MLLLPSSWSVVNQQALFNTSESQEGHKYAMVFVQWWLLRCFGNKSDATRPTEQSLADTSSNGNVKRLQSDNGGEYINEECRSLMLKNQSNQKESAPFSPHQSETAQGASGGHSLTWLDAC